MTREEEIRARLEAANSLPVDFIANASTDIDYLLKENQRLQTALELSTNLHEGRRQTTKHMEELYNKAISENKRLQDANNTMAAYLQSLANPDAWNGRTYIRGFREPWVYADDALRYAGIEEREPRQALEGRTDAVQNHE